MPQISVIVPIYNVEKYLDRCVQSILRQTFTDYELILVDDGSPDKCPEMCDRYALQDSRVRVIHKPNGGLSDARNAGIEACCGEYISFIDSDDYIEPEMLSVLMQLILSKNAEIACCGIKDCYENNTRFSTTALEQIDCNGIEALALTLEGKKIGGSVCNKLINKSFLGNHRFIKGKTYEDAFFTPELLGKAKKVAITTQPLYNYWHRAGSITECKYSQRSLDVIEAYDYTLKYVQKNAPDLEKLAKFRLCWANFVVLDRMLRTDDYKNIAQYKQVVAFLRKNTAFIALCPYFRKSRRIAGVALAISPAIYHRLSAYHDRSNATFT